MMASGDTGRTNGDARDTRLDLTKTQRLMWAGQKLYPDVPLYNMAFAFRINGRVESELFERSVRETIEASDALRTVFGEDGGVPHQTIRGSIPYDLEVVDFTGVADAGRLTESWMADRCLQMFDLAERTFDIALLRLGENETVWYFNQHHIVSDAWSTSRLFRFVSDRYRNLSSGIERKAKPLPHYGEYVKFERGGTQLPEGHQAREHWTGKHAEISQATVSYYGRGAATTMPRSERIVCPLGRDRSDRIRELASRPDFGFLTPHLSAFNVFATVLAAYLHRVRNERSITIGAPSHNRVSRSFKDSPGLFIELFPLTVSVDARDSFRSLLSRVKQESISFLRNAAPGTSATESSRHLSAVLNYIDVSFSSFNGWPTSTQWLHPGFVDPAHHLRIEVVDLDSSGEWTLLIDANTDVFGGSKQALLADHIVRMMDAFLADPSQVIGLVDLVGEAERRQLLSWSSTRNSGMNGLTILDVFDERVRDASGCAAVVAGDQRLTYAQLDDRATGLAVDLVNRGIEPGSIIGLYHDRSAGLAAGILGILKAGCAWLPISPHDPMERASFMLADAGSPAVVTQTEFADRFGGSAVPVVNLDDLTDAQIEPGLLASVEVTPDSLSYVIYTSGSTGEPKGALNTHRGVVCLAEALRERIYDRYPDHLDVAMVAPIVFDLSVQQIFGALLLGHTLHIVPETTRRDGGLLFSYFNEHKIDVSDGTPAHLRLLLDATRELLPELVVKHFIIAGEALPAELVRRFITRFGRRDLHITNAYGVAECAVLSTAQLVNEPDLDQYATVPIGTPLIGSRLYVVNSLGTLQPAGVPGELCIGGSGVGLGYLNRDELTVERFTTDIHNPAGRMYKTGDIARFLSDGRLLFMGRQDNQVKIRGHRVELGEIEHRLRTYHRPPVRGEQDTAADTSKDEQVRILDVSVVDLENDDDSRSLCAYFVANAELTVSEIRAFLTGHLPDYMIPSYFIQIEAIPLTTNGKVDRSALPRPDRSRPALENVPVPPRNPTEFRLAEIWGEVLSVETVGVHDRFLDLGGTSLDAVQLMTLVNDEFGIDLPLATVFDTPTVAQLAEQVEQILRDEIERMGDDEAVRSNRARAE